MLNTRFWTGLRASAVALVVSGAFASIAHAAPVVTYGTTGSIGGAQIDGIPVINYSNIAQPPPADNPLSGTIETPSNLSLGHFQVNALPENTSTTYNGTPFTITFIPYQVNGISPAPIDPPTIQLTGTISGTVTGTNQVPALDATFDTTEINFRTGDYLNTLSVLNPTLSLVPANTNGGVTTVQAHLVTTYSPLSTPEPTTIAVFLTAAAGLGLRRKLLASR